MKQKLVMFKYYVEVAPDNICPMYFSDRLTYDKAFAVHDNLMDQQNVVDVEYRWLEVTE